jgi:hypothetical protein
MGMGIRKAGAKHFTSKTRKRAAALAMTGAAAVAAVVLAAPAGASPLAPRTAPAVTGTEHFQIMTTSGTSTRLSLIMYGLFTAPGVDHERSANLDTFVMAGGTFNVKHSNPVGPQTSNSKTCLFTESGHGTYTISGGTGKYKGISGHGKYTLTILDIQPKTKSGACNENAAPTAYQQVVDAVGPVTRP